MIINTARFAISNATHTKCPSDKRHEYAFIGRSNVGKSSLINMLTGKSKLAKTSSTPGKTLLINHFLINDEWYIVDLPGYGFAPMKIDLEFFNWLGENGVPFSIVFTKLDKLGNDVGRRNVEKYLSCLMETWEELPPVFLTSSEDKRGRKEILDYIEELNKLPIESGE